MTGGEHAGLLAVAAEDFSFPSSFGGLDWVLIVLAIAFALVGWVQGFVVGVLSFVGFVGGAAAGLLVVPRALDGLQPGLGTAVLATLLVMLAAGLGYGVLSMIGDRVRHRLGSGSARRVDGLAGAVVATVGFLLAAWGIGLAVSSSGIPGIASAARTSVVLGLIDDTVPLSPDRLNDAFRSVVEAGGFPQVVAPFVEEEIVPVEAPDPGQERTERVRGALGSVFKVATTAPVCDRIQEGSAVLVAPGRLLTNAHVVAGSDEVVVAASGRPPVPAQVVYFDAAVDVALLDAPGAEARPLSLVDGGIDVGDDVVVAGFPGGGGLSTEAGRVRGTNTLLGLDIYGQDRVQREVVAIRGEVAPGNSGGPLLDPRGGVVGLVFATSLTDRSTGYALANSELAAAMRVADVPDVTAVPTGACTP